MKRSNKTAAYSRSPETRGNATSYEVKFAGLIQLCSRAKTDGFQNIMVSWPWVIGDNYEEVIESLSRIADAGLVLHVVQRGDDEHIIPPGIERQLKVARLTRPAFITPAQWGLLQFF